ncbi:molybdate ABC transporter permease subunit [Maricaulis alexandrii]|uniref:molybdate ABC transporter permease subunit n=1 Tax=Maricaulis alexandrii TaxID=2570354 RepID=UPI0011099803|nr:molybdate ABC transporter permease subunit [Maricaulis alexandrii]
MSGSVPAILLTLNLAAVTTLILFVLGTPLAWWLANTRSRVRPFIEAITALPLILPPTVIGFYLLILLNPTAPIGRFWVTVTGDTLTFSFAGLVIASILYSLPFMVQPLQTAFDRIGRDQIEAAASLGASPLDRFFSLVLPLSARGFLTAGILTFIHTIGEFGVVLMVGGNIPGRTRTLSIALYDHVEALRYDQAHALAAGLVILSLIVLSLVYWLNRRSPRHDG